jgi:Type II transport protein GspH
MSPEPFGQVSNRFKRGGPSYHRLIACLHGDADKRSRNPLGSEQAITSRRRAIALVTSSTMFSALNVDPGVAHAIDTFIVYALAAVGGLAALEAVGVGVGTITLYAGAFGIGLGFGVQSLANNLASGMTIIFSQALRRGDIVTVGRHDWRGAGGWHPRDADENARRCGLPDSQRRVHHRKDHQLDPL